MTKDQAAAIGGAIADIESGRIELGVRLLRTVIAMAGHRPPPERIVEARQPKQPSNSKE